MREKKKKKKKKNLCGDKMHDHEEHDFIRSLVTYDLNLKFTRLGSKLTNI